MNFNLKEELEKWKKTRIVIWVLFGAFALFIIIGIILMIKAASDVVIVQTLLGPVSQKSNSLLAFTGVGFALALVGSIGQGITLIVGRVLKYSLANKIENIYLMQKQYPSNSNLIIWLVLSIFLLPIIATIIFHVKANDIFAKVQMLDSLESETTNRTLS
ncbi:hypothetical protein [Mesomycoplasma neurolyticum]|uniref:Uncharacterized protein n=1 Tax=Mesomycoplasma neurolyticum TaxID=2120 RepID=A0A449A5H9_9BACT|nr:hypothetical protein [Mesomycoplasma neurolyticum]VEU59496.1 Uncharacterised protein [Mesomycoplasma neurolyticum]